MEETQGEKERDHKGIGWGEELEDSTLARLQRSLEVEFDANFEDTDYGSKGFARSSGLPFYTDLETEIPFHIEGNAHEIEMDIEIASNLHIIRYWIDDQDVMKYFEDFVEKFRTPKTRGMMIEPYAYSNVKDLKVRELLYQFSNHFRMQGPLHNSGNGQPRMYAIREREMEEENGETILGKSSKTEEYSEESWFNLEEDELIIPGDAKFNIVGMRNEQDADFVEGEVKISPERQKGEYEVKINADDEKSLLYIINEADGILTVSD